MNITGRPIKILLVEDNPGDVRLTQEALRESGLPTHLQVAIDGVEALATLRQLEPSFRPDLILLDLNLPRKSGCEVLAEIKTDETLKRIPVIVLTTSSADEDIGRAYGLHANCYIAKPVNLDRFFQVVRVIEDFWLNTVLLPVE
jgi:two-component system, chemotaxis family, response regulator Rcp1